MDPRDKVPRLSRKKKTTMKRTISLPWDDVGRLVLGNEGAYESSHYGSFVATYVGFGSDHLRRELYNR